MHKGGIKAYSNDGTRNNACAVVLAPGGLFVSAGGLCNGGLSDPQVKIKRALQSKKSVPTFDE